MTDTFSPAQEQILSEIGSFAQEHSGANFVSDAACLLAEKLGVSYVLIGKLVPPENNTVRTVALYASGRLVENMEYSLFGTPCENVVGRNMCYYPFGVQALFPTDKELKDLAVESYMGVPLFGAEREPMGLIVLMHTDTISEAAFVESALKLLAPRLEQELLTAAETTVPG